MLSRTATGALLAGHAPRRLVSSIHRTAWAAAQRHDHLGYSCIHSSSWRLLDTERQTSSQQQPPLPLNGPQQQSRRRTPTGATSSFAATERTAYPHGSTAQNPLSPPPLDARLPKKKITSVADLPSRFGKNQIIAVPEQVQRDLEDVLTQFKAPIRFAFAYGSGVFRQKGYTAEDKPLLDFVFAVSHPSHWHAVNMQQHPDHYSMPMRLLGSDAVAWMQERGLGAGVWFNVEVEVNGKTIKYGVISIDALCRDMLDWETLYISGRTQKPVRILVDDARVRLANQVNLASALRTALLLLPESFNEVELFETIAGLSYTGDFRMAVGENPRKVRNIVDAQLEAFRSLYGGLLKSFWKSVYVIGEQPLSSVSLMAPTTNESQGNGAAQQERTVRQLRQDTSVSQRASIAKKLPNGLKKRIMGFYERKWNLKAALAANSNVATPDNSDATPAQNFAKELDEQQLWEKIVQDEEFRRVLQDGIGAIVRRPTFNQSLKGILSAGPMKSLRYIGPKLRKKWGARKQQQAVSAPTQNTPAAPNAGKQA
ncbi:Mitochondrial translocator assembly and maintenance protein 41 [Microbotryomycetes sp. JL201]|nr:Mitochondrial translocator assembly and maintenance protein 41 [Microbotryomycetes sp. JL201]